MNKKILIIDDDLYKVNRIKTTLLDEFDNPNIMVCSSRNDGLITIMNNKDIDLIILDWIFPIRNGDNPQQNMGLEVLEMLQNMNIEVDIIICSSEITESIHELVSNYPNVKGTVSYDLSVKLSFEGILGRGRKLEKSV